MVADVLEPPVRLRDRRKVRLEVCAGDVGEGLGEGDWGEFRGIGGGGGEPGHPGGVRSIDARFAAVRVVEDGSQALVDGVGRRSAGLEAGSCGEGAGPSGQIPAPRSSGTSR